MCNFLDSRILSLNEKKKKKKAEYFLSNTLQFLKVLLVRINRNTLYVFPLSDECLINIQFVLAGIQGALWIFIILGMFWSFGL